ncbi:MAG: sigma-70 family RNA polymerase sigma factor [Chitinophagaceae bacterium]|nr:sigma-70 family RNA polymerase sigma factor [Chitinophagaceae bacterium]
MSSEPIHTEHQLLVRIAAGDEGAFANLFNRYRNKIFSIAYRITTSEQVAEEIVLDVFLKVWLKKEQLPGLEFFTAWLFTVTRNQVFTAMKQMAIRRNAEYSVRHDEYLNSADVHTELLDKEYQELLREAIARLSPQQKKVYLLIKEQGLKREEAAQELNLSPETVKRHLAEAMQAIRVHCLSRADLYSTLIIIKELL